MKLADAPIEDGDLLFFRGRAWYSRLIRWWTGSPYSHVAAVLSVRFTGSPERIPVAFEAMEGYGGGVRPVPLAPYLASSLAQGVGVTWRPLAENASIDRAKMAAYLVSTWGESYSSPLQFLWSFGRLSRWLQRRLGLRAELDTTRPFCSWEIVKALEAAGWCRPWTIPDPADWTPGDVFNLDCLGAAEVLSP